MMADDPSEPSWNRRRFVSTSLAVGVPSWMSAEALQAETAVGVAREAGLLLTLGPLLGPVDHASAMVWMRATVPGEYVLEVVSERDGGMQRLALSAIVDMDLCLHWHIEGLAPSTRYQYRIWSGQTLVAGRPGQVITTAASPGTPGRVRLAISSCAREDEGSRAVWQRMAAENVDAVVLLGDTPYIDSTDREVQLRRHREFAAVEEYQQLLASRPCWWTWDDHDFAGNDASGLAVGKAASRWVFSRYRPQHTYGVNGEGIFTRFRRGALEVFLLDTRWFAMTEASWADPVKPSFLGRVQWEWLRRGLLESTASFKLLACGVIWDDKENSESDDWGTYGHERRALEAFIGEHRIPGVVLVGGDIHASRVLRYASRERVGYDLVQFIASPIHGETIPSLNVYHPHLKRSAVEPHVFLRVDVDDTCRPARLESALINRHGEVVFSYVMTADDLKPA